MDIGSLILIVIAVMFFLYPDQMMGFFETLLSLVLSFIISVLQLIYVLPMIVCLSIAAGIIGLFLLGIIAYEWVYEKITKLFVA